MEIIRLSLIGGAKQARGLAVIIDVFRAFSTAAYAFDRGAQEVILVGEVAQAFELKKKFPDALLAGEVGGRYIQGFDFGNSPSIIAQSDLRGKRLIQRTSAGTQGVVNAMGADEVVLGSLVCARAIVEHILQKNPAIVSLVAMGYAAEEKAEEDEACAELLAARLRGDEIDENALIDRIRQSRAVQRFLGDTPDLPRADVDYCLALDRFHFVMPVTRADGLLVARRWPQ